MKKIALLLIISLTLVALTSMNFAIADQGKVRVIVGFKEDVNQATIQDLGGDLIRQNRHSTSIVANLPPRAIEALKNNPKIAYVEEDAVMTALEYVVTNELVNSWGVERIGGGIAQAYGNAGEGIKVAVVDTGINYNHRELAANIAKDELGNVIGYNAITGLDNANDDNGHGSHCAGIVAAVADPADPRIVGVAAKATLYPVKVLDASGSGYVSDIAEGIQWAIGQGVDVISMSLGGPSGSQDLQQAIQDAENAKIVVVASAGNSGQARFGSNVGYPAKYLSVIAVAATDSNNIRASFSSTGIEVDISAPGVNIISSILRDDTYYYSGTSMACPHVAGAAALLLKANPNLSPSQVTNILIGSADDLGSTGKDNLYGYGLVDVDRALSLATTAGPSTLPNTVTASKGSVTGAISETLSADDNKYMTLKSGKAGSSQVSDTSYKLTLPQKQSQIDTLTVTSISMYSSTVTQNLYIYDYTTKAWTLMKNPSIGQTEQTTVFTVSNAARYVSANGEVNARIYTSKSTSFTGSLDVFNFAVTYVP